jgi:predicted Fe-S protein YdhL (DUF1289 family)
MSIPGGIPSPCIAVCTLDRTGRICTGCFRSLEEIARWESLAEAERNGVLAALPERRRLFAART